jgi:hypothetical protein
MLEVRNEYAISGKNRQRHEVTSVGKDVIYSLHAVLVHERNAIFRMVLTLVFFLLK